ncbi:MAG: energy-coupling factor ABC transporter ATP-binding protein [Dorea sp.]
MEKPVLKNITFSAHEKDSIGIIGANGAGKSTLLKLLVGLNLNYKGSIRIEEIPIEKRILPKIRERIGYVFQDSDSQLFMPSVYEDVAFAPRNYGLPEGEVDKRVTDALSSVHILHLKDKPTYKLSGGEKKLVSIDKILLSEGRIVADGKTKDIFSDKALLEKMDWNFLYTYKIEVLNEKISIYQV